LEKKQLRQQMKALRAQVSPDQAEIWSRALAQSLFSTQEYRTAKSVFLYLSMPGEVDTMPVLARARADGKRIAVPKVLGKGMSFFWLEPDTVLAPSAFGVLEPENAALARDETALIIVPGLAFRPDGFRCGYGGGYYDRYLAAHPGCPTAALCFDFQITRELEPDEHDIPVQQILTPSRMFFCEKKLPSCQI